MNDCDNVVFATISLFSVNSSLILLLKVQYLHKNKNHSEDLKFITKIPDIIENFSEIKKSFVEDKKTKKPIYAIEFYKKYNDKTVKAVKIHLRKEKILRLKTLFIPKK